MSLIFYDEVALSLDIIDDIKETMKLNYMKLSECKEYAYERVLLMLEHYPFNIYISSFESNGKKITDIIMYKHPEKGIVVEDLYCKIEPTEGPYIKIPDENRYMYLLNETLENPSNIDIECIATHLIFKELQI